MRFVLLAVAFVMLLGVQADSSVMRITIYDDGKSCPGGCDAHFVANAADNGTRYVSDPASSRASPRRCVTGRLCRICFGNADSTCMTALYRGGGPGARTIDATPAFFAAHCGRPGNPVALVAYCRSLDRAITANRYDRRINCIAEPTHPRCAAIIARARQLQAEDEPRYAECLRLGEASYNRAQTDPRRQRSLECAYTRQSLGGPNSRGTRWRLLLPGACRPGTYVGRDGLDCCSADVRFAASNHRECSIYFPER